jgi:DNA polymerase (family 10)
MDRKKIASAFEETAVLLELKGENPFKIRAYSQAARAVLSLESDPAELVESGEIKKVKGLGKTTAAHVAELVSTGRMEYLEELKSSFPPGLLDILDVPGLGPKKVKVLYEDLGIETLGELEYACKENRLVTFKGFGAKTQANVLKGIETLKKYRGRFLWAEVEPHALAMRDRLAECPYVTRAELAGSFRRFKEVVKDIDLVAASESPDKVVAYLKRLETVDEILSGGDTKISFRLASGMNVDLRLVPENDFTFAWHHFTGSKDHNTQLRQRAKSKGLKLNEYGLFDDKEKTPKIKDEAELFKLLDLDFIPPELREGMGEIEAAEKNDLPDLIQEKDLRGVFHVHSNYSDGGLSLKEIVKASRDMGFEYLGLSDHSQSAFYAGGLKEDDLKRQSDEIEALRQDNPDFTIFWGIESDILPDGSLDYPDKVLAKFDFVIASVHSSFSLPEPEMTKRLIKAAQNPYTTIMGHITGRLLLAREPYALNLRQVLEAAAESGTIVEVNANPHRLDLDWREMRAAKALGLKTIICPDAHSAEGLKDVRYGIHTARKGWLTKDDVINCLPADEIKQVLSAKRNK